MRIAIPSLPSPDSLSLKAMLESAGYLVVSDFPSYTIRLVRGSHPWIVVDVPDAVFGRLLTHRIGEQAPWDGVFVKANGGNQNDKAAIIEIPDNDAKALEAVCVGTMRALDQIQKIATQPAKTAEPFLNASEVIAQAVTMINAHTSEQTTTMIGTISDAVQASVTVNAAQLKQMQQDMEHMQVVIGDQMQMHVTTQAERASTDLFRSLIDYYTRPRWWQPRSWITPKP